MNITTITTSSNKSNPAYCDTSTKCGLCPCQYYDDPTTTIQLGCGHYWHLECLRQQLAQPQRPSERLVVGASACAKCSIACNHPALSDHIAWSADVLLQPKVDQILAQHLPEINNNNNNNGEPFLAIADQTRDKYVFYLCCLCQEPYLGGKVNKDEQQQQQEEEDKENQLSDCDEQYQRICPKCQTSCEQQLPQRTWQQQPTHQAADDNSSFIVYKCRYCCSPATRHVSRFVHMCEACHNRSVHLHDNTTSHGRQYTLEPIPCPGDQQCPFPKPKRSNFL